MRAYRIGLLTVGAFLCNAPLLVSAHHSLIDSLVTKNVIGVPPSRPCCASAIGDAVTHSTTLSERIREFVMSQSASIV